MFCENDIVNPNITSNVEFHNRYNIIIIEPSTLELLESIKYIALLITLFYFFIYSFIGLNIIFNIIEYFSFINLCLLFLFIIISIFFILIKSTLLYYSNININHCLIEFTSTLFSLLFLILIISPALIILLDFDLIILPSFIIYSLGLQ